MSGYTSAAMIAVGIGERSGPNSGFLWEKKDIPKICRCKKQMTASMIVQSRGVTFSFSLTFCNVWLKKSEGKRWSFVDTDPDGVNCSEEAYVQLIM